MNRLRFYTYIILFCFIPIGLTDCSKSDPTDPADLIEGIMTEAQIQLSLNIWGLPNNANWGSLMVQHWTNPARPGRTLYAVNGSDFDEYWITMFLQVLNPLRQIKSLVDDREAPDAVKTNQKAITDILTVYCFHQLTDGFGDMPVLQFLDDESSVTQPRYDSQSEIYDRLLDLLDQALLQMDESIGSFSTGDIIFRGDVAKWKKFGYSLMLRMAMRMADVNPSGAEQYVQKAEGEVFESNADNALFVFSGAPSIANPFFIEFNTGDLGSFYFTNTMIDQLENTNDPRLPLFATQNENGEYQGMPYGNPRPTDGEISGLNEVIYRVDAPAILMDYAEVAFLLAEAYQRNILTGSAADAYTDGVRASMEFWGVVEPGVITDYLTNNPYDAANWRASIGTQKWLAFYGNGSQAWAEWRRLDQPQLSPPSEAVINVIPARLPYPNIEQIDNFTQLSRVTNDPNDVTEKVWWDVN